MKPETKKQTIMIVDDEPENIRILSNLLKPAYSITAAVSGRDALETVLSYSPDLIVLDILMPGMDGYEVCEKLKAGSKTRDIPVIFITALEKAENETRGFEVGAVDYITKPFNPAVVEARVRTHLELKQHREKLKKKIRGLKKTMDISTKHSDVVTYELEGKVEASIREIEERIRLISETIPVPLVISQVTDGKTLYANAHASSVFGYSQEELMNLSAAGFYENQEDRRTFMNRFSENGRVDNFEVSLKKKDGSDFWAALFSQPMEFKNQPCMVTVIYDLSEQKKAAEEIRRLNEELESRKEREEKYLIFSLADEEYGLPLLKIREIIGWRPMTPVPNGPQCLEGVINLRGVIIPVYDLGSKLGAPPCEHTDKTSIIITEIEMDEGLKQTGLIVDVVEGVISVKGKFIDSPPVIGQKVDTRYISGIAKTENGMKVLLDLGYIFGTTPCKNDKHY